MLLCWNSCLGICESTVQTGEPKGGVRAYEGRFEDVKWDSRLCLEFSTKLSRNKAEDGKTVQVRYSKDFISILLNELLSNWPTISPKKVTVELRDYI